MRFTMIDTYGKKIESMNISHFTKEINGLEFPKIKAMEIGDTLAFSRKFGSKILKFERTH